jgi:hypothetical protein
MTKFDNQFAILKSEDLVGFTYVIFSLIMLPNLYTINSLVNDLKERKNSSWNRNLSISPTSSYLILFSYFFFTFIYTLALKCFTMLIFIIMFGVQTIHAFEIGWIIFYLFQSSLYISVLVNFVSFIFYKRIKLFNILFAAFGLAIVYIPFMISIFTENLTSADRSKLETFIADCLRFVPTRCLYTRLFMVLKLVFAYNGSGISNLNMPKSENELLKQHPWSSYHDWSDTNPVGEYEDWAKDCIDEKIIFVKKNFFKLFSFVHEITMFLIMSVFIIIVCAMVFVRDEKTYTK